MDSRTLVKNMFSGAGFDRVGLFDHYWPETPKLWMADGYPVKEDGEPEPPSAVFGLDMRGCGGGFDVNPIRGYKEILQETDEWIVTRNGAGAAFKYWKSRSGTPEHIDFLMTNREVWERDYRPHLQVIDRERFDLEGTRRSVERARSANAWVYYGHMFIWETMRQSLGDVCMYESLALDPGWIHDFCRVYTDFFKMHSKVVFDDVGVPDGVWLYEDLGYRGGLFASPKTLRDLIFPYFAELVDYFHGYGIPVVLHSCGGITQALPLIVDAGFDALNPMEVKAGCDLFDLAERYGERLVFVGGLDVRILETNDRAVIERGVTEIVEGMKARGARFLFGSDHSITPLVTYDSYRFALDVYRAHSAY